MPKHSINTKEKTGITKDSPERFVVFVARGERPVISFSNFVRAEHLAIIFARLANVRMEVFDSKKEICYFVEPERSETLLLFINESRFAKTKK